MLSLKKSFTALLLVISFSFMPLAAQDITQEVQKEAQKTTIQEIKATLSKTIDFCLLFGTAAGLMAATATRLLHEDPTSEQACDSINGGLMLSVLCATAYVIKNKCI